MDTPTPQLTGTILHRRPETCGANLRVSQGPSGIEWFPDMRRSPPLDSPVVGVVQKTRSGSVRICARHPVRQVGSVSVGMKERSIGRRNGESRLSPYEAQSQAKEAQE